MDKYDGTWRKTAAQVRLENQKYDAGSMVRDRTVAMNVPGGVVVRQMARDKGGALCFVPGCRIDVDGVFHPLDGE